MWIAETLLVGLALAMDAFAVTIANSFAYPHDSRRRTYMAPVMFAVFQGAMPLVGYLVGSYFAQQIMRYQGIVSLVILGIIGGKMIYDGVKELRHPALPGSQQRKGHLTMSVIVLQAIATSIDALAVGVTYASGVVSIWTVALIIALTTLGACTVSWLIGRRFGDLLGSKAQVVGGIVLVCIGIKALFF